MKKKFLSAMLSAAMLVSVMPQVVSLAEENERPWVLFEEDFSEAFDAATSSYRIVNLKGTYSEIPDDNGSRFPYWDVGNGDGFAPTLSNGILNVGYCGGRKPAIMLKSPVWVPDGHEIVVEAKVRYKAQNSNKFESGISIANGSNPLFNFLNTTADFYAQGVRISQPGNNSTLISGGGDGTAVSSDMNLLDSEWVTFSAAISSDGKKYSYTVSKDNGEKYTSPLLNSQRAITDLKYIQIPYGAWTGTALDYIKVYDKSLIPAPTAKVNGVDLNGSYSVKAGDVITVESPIEMAASDIKLDNAAIAATLSNGDKTATITVPSMSARSMHTLSINGTAFSFRSADEAQYIYRAEFDGLDDDTPWYGMLNDVGEGLAKTYPFVTNGYYEESTENKGGYWHLNRAFSLVFEKANLTFKDQNGCVYKAPAEAQKIDCAGKENVVIETRVNAGDGTLDDQFIYVYNILKIAAAGRTLKTNGGQTLMDLEANKWYNITLKLNYVNHTYKAIIEDEAGNVVASDAEGFISAPYLNSIPFIRFSRMLSGAQARVKIDYVRIIDGGDLVPAEIKYATEKEFTTGADNTTATSFFAELTANDFSISKIGVKVNENDDRGTRDITRITGTGSVYVGIIVNNTKENDEITLYVD